MCEDNVTRASYADNYKLQQQTYNTEEGHSPPISRRDPLCNTRVRYDYRRCDSSSLPLYDSRQGTRHPYKHTTAHEVYSMTIVDTVFQSRSHLPFPCNHALLHRLCNPLYLKQASTVTCNDVGLHSTGSFTQSLTIYRLQYQMTT